jgi:Trm5-related predicted tRNA methylase
MARAERESRDVWLGVPLKAKREGTELGKQKRKDRAEAFLQACKQGIRVVIDCSFEDKMGDREKKSLVQQIMYCHGANKRASRPCSLFITSIEGLIGKGLHGISGFNDWPGVVSTDAPYESLFPSESLVYLTAG